MGAPEYMYCVLEGDSQEPAVGGFESYADKLGRCQEFSRDYETAQRSAARLAASKMSPHCVLKIETVVVVRMTLDVNE